MKENSKYYELSSALEASLVKKRDEYIVLRQKVNEILPILKDEFSKYLGYEENDYVDFSFDNYRYIDGSFCYDFVVNFGGKNQGIITMPVIFSCGSSVNENKPLLTITLRDSENENTLFTFPDVCNYLSFKTFNDEQGIFNGRKAVRYKESFLMLWFGVFNKNIEKYNPYEKKVVKR